MKSGDTSGIYFETSSRKTGTTDGTSNARSCEKFSVFGDGSCGEPLFPQHLNIDFTPNDDIDNDFVQRKICSFWKFIENTPEIHNLRVKPEITPYINASSTNVVSETETVKSDEEFTKVIDIPAEKTAVSMLEVVGAKLIGRTLEGKLPQSQCTLGSREYKEMDTFTQPKKKEKRTAACYCTKICSSACRNRFSKAGKTSAEYLSPLRKLSRTLKDWDAEHPNGGWYIQQHFEPMNHQMKQMTKVDLNKEDLKIDAERSSGEPMRAQHLVIDFTPGREDTPEIQARCQQFWQFTNNHPELKGIKVEPTPDLEHHLVDFQSNMSTTSPDSFTQRNNLPAIHMMKKIDKKGVVKAALEAGQVNRSYT